MTDPTLRPSSYDLWDYCKSLFLLSVLLQFFPNPVISGYPIHLAIYSGGELVDGTNYSTTWSTVVLLSIIMFVEIYATGIGNVPSQQGELFALVHFANKF